MKIRTVIDSIGKAVVLGKVLLEGLVYGNFKEKTAKVGPN